MTAFIIAAILAFLAFALGLERGYAFRKKEEDEDRDRHIKQPPQEIGGDDENFI